MPRKKRPLERDSDTFRDATLIVIASEDTHAAQEYFARFRARRIKFTVLPTIDGASSPQSLLDRLDEFRDEYATEDGDQFWYCGDTDHWILSNHIQNLTSVLQHCRQKSYGVALSRPCFEFWLLLHFVEGSIPDDAIADHVVEQLRSVAGGYSKRCGCSSEITADMVEDAIRRAKAIDAAREQIPSKPASQVYLILEELIKRDTIDLT